MWFSKGNPYFLLRQKVTKKADTFGAKVTKTLLFCGKRSKRSLRLTAR